eukprot:c18490_g1_i1 orf=3-170(-)
MLHKQQHRVWMSYKSVKALHGHCLIANSSLRCMPSLSLIRSASLNLSLIVSASTCP